MPKSTHTESDSDRIYTFDTIEQHPAVRRHGLSRRICERAYYRGDLIGYKPGLRVTFRAADVDAWIEGSRSDHGRR